MRRDYDPKENLIGRYETYDSRNSNQQNNDWPLEQFKEIDYRKEYQQIESFNPISQEHQKMNIQQQFLLFEKNLLLLNVCSYQQDEKSHRLEIRNLTTKALIKTIQFNDSSQQKLLAHHSMNFKDYIVISIASQIYLFDLDKIDNLQDCILKIDIESDISIQQSYILDEFRILLQFTSELLSEKKILFVLSLDDPFTHSVKQFHNLKIQLSEKDVQDYQNQYKDEPVFIKSPTQNFLYTTRSISYINSPRIREYFFIFSDKLLMINKQTFEITQKFDKSYILVGYCELQYFFISWDRKLYRLDDYFQLQFMKQLEFKNNTYPIDSRDVGITNNKLVLKVNADSIAIFDIFTLDYLNEIQEILASQNIINVVNNYVVYWSLNDSVIIISDIEGKYPCKEINREYSSKIQLLRLIDLNNLSQEEIEEKLSNFDIQQTNEISQTDKLIFIDEENMIYLNNYRKISVDKVMKDQEFQYVCLMSDKINDQIYIFAFQDQRQVMYYNIRTAEFIKIELLEDLPSFTELRSCWIDFNLNILIIYGSYYGVEDFLTAINLKTRQQIQEIQLNKYEQYPTVFIEQNYIQISTNKRIRVYLFKNETLQQVIQMNSNSLDCRSYFQQKSLNQPGYYIKEFNNIPSDQGIVANSIGILSNTNTYNHLIVLATYFKQAQKIIIDKGKIKLYYANNEINIAGYIDSDIDHDTLRKFTALSKMTHDQAVVELKNIQIYTKFVTGFGNCINMFQNNFPALEYIYKYLSLLDADQIPILIISNMYGQSNPLDIALKNKQQKIINLLLQILLKYQNHILFNEIIDKNLCELIKQNINLHEYFCESNLALQQITNDSFPSQHSDSQELLLPINLVHSQDILTKYNETFGCIVENDDSEDSSQVTIEYSMVNLPYTLSKNPKELMITLSKSDMHENFESPVIQNIINFKWEAYTKSYYQTKFYIFLIFFGSFIFESFNQAYYGLLQQNFKNDQRNVSIVIASKVISLCALLSILMDEIRQIRIQGKTYFNNAWNYFDSSYIVSYLTLSFFEQISINSDLLVLLYILAILLTFMKLYFYIRIYDQFSFLVSMMAGVFGDVKYFLAFFMIFILQFGLIFTILFRAKDVAEYRGVELLTYFLMIFRTASGDYVVDLFSEQNSSFLVALSWMIWLIAVVILNIVFMNFIIAVISESYSKVMEKLTAESYKVKANMIVEREQLFNEQDLINQRLFPQYIIIRRQLDINAGDAGEWKGFLKDLKNVIEVTSTKSKNDIIQNQVQLNKIPQILDQQKSKLETTQQEVKGDLTLLKNEISGIKTDVDSMKNDIMTIKNQVNGIENLLQESISKILEKLNK
ncbi:UNKNOWN [Stylonychia lemnae]|uniref:Ion transport domain-containing protein n=1 Tax=Stylonychia lemnae TaxID=5949 RepID=A0A078B0V6_STYLE|nr:UNKNOWN [Stylonychia lemnae]|eukprot:CDW86987.1 UNKNOWN [Stylonychia lemnae]